MLDKAFASIDLRKRALDGSWIRNQLITNNLANANTPGYKRQDVDFQQVLKDFLDKGNVPMARTHPGHLPLGGEDVNHLGFPVTTETGTSVRRDENNVNIDIEMAELAKNQIYYNTVSTSVSGSISRLRTAIREGR